MNRKTFIAAAAACAALAGGLWYLAAGMEAAEVVRKLSGLRLSLAFYAREHKALPAAFEDTVRVGNLEAPPALKLPRHFRTSSVRNVDALRITDRGGWAYVNAPGDRNFGVLFIDCSHRDGKGRFWSEF